MSSPTNSNTIYPICQVILINLNSLGFSKYVVNFEDDTPIEIIDTQIDLIQSRGKFSLQA
jgi:bifunctional ADP-heptose synthase (sugar kinase/adenylyltransferase)